MPKSPIDAKFLASAWALLDHAHKCCVIWRLGDEEFTCASTLQGSGEVRAMLIDVVARSVIGEGHAIEDIADVVTSDYLTAHRTKLREEDSCQDLKA